MRRLLAVAGLTLFVFGAAPAAASSPDDLANAIASEISSPFCPGVTLANCPSDNAVALRARILSWARAGWSKDRIMTTLEDEYGTTISAVPPKSGVGLWAWVAPGLALLLGSALIVALGRRWTASPPGRTDGADLSAEMRSRVADELDALRGRS